MVLKSEKDIVKNILKKYVVRENNLIKVNRLFVAISVVRWVFSSTKDTEEILGYLSQLERFLEGEINLYWEDSVIKISRNKKE